MPDLETARRWWGDGERAVAAALDRLRRLDDLEAFHAANQLSQSLYEAIGEVGVVRAQAASRIRDTRNLSLRELAAILGVSRGRAGQLIQHARSRR